MDVELDRERNYEACVEEFINGVGRMELISWEEQMGTERNKKRKV